jgi:hypothetical protein
LSGAWPREIRSRPPARGTLGRRNKKPTAGKPEIGAQLVSFNFLNRLICTLRSTTPIDRAPYLQRDWCREVLAAPIRREVQLDGRIRFWGKIELAGEARPRFLRVVTLEDGETVHNAFFDRNFREDAT